jgi:hypothetical protein
MNSNNKNVLEEMDRSNKERINFLSEKIKRIKDVTITIHDHLEKEKEGEMKNIKNSFLVNNPLLNQVIEKIGNIGTNTNFFLYLMMFGFGFLVLFILYLIK